MKPKNPLIDNKDYKALLDAIDKWSLMHGQAHTFKPPQMPNLPPSQGDKTIKELGLDYEKWLLDRLTGLEAEKNKKKESETKVAKVFCNLLRFVKKEDRLLFLLQLTGFIKHFKHMDYEVHTEAQAASVLNALTPYLAEVDFAEDFDKALKDDEKLEFIP